jgi:hypothetical protein
MLKPRPEYLTIPISNCSIYTRPNPSTYPLLHVPLGTFWSYSFTEYACFQLDNVLMK